MTRGVIKLQHPEKFTDGFTVPEEKLEKTLQAVLKKLKEKSSIYRDSFPGNKCIDYRYELTTNNNWIHGMHTGCYLLGYEATGDKEFLEVAKYQLTSYQRRLNENIGLDDHDVGFVFSPSCVAYYKITGDEYAKELAMKAADILYERSFSENGGFIMRFSVGKTTTDEKDKDRCRTMMDTMMNAPLFFWRGKMTGEEKFTKAALAQCETTEKTLIRADGSSYHHYQFEVGTHKPLYGVTFQGNRDESTWSRGHSWGMIGYPIAYNYVQEEYMVPLHRDITYYFLNHLPEDFIPYWDFDFDLGDEPRDSSAAAIAVCGMLEAMNVMPYSESEKKILLTAAHKIMNSLIDKYTTESGEEYDGLMTGVTAARKMPGFTVEGCALYGDYFFLEALVRMCRPEWSRCW